MFPWAKNYVFSATFKKVIVDFDYRKYAQYQKNFVPLVGIEVWGGRFGL